MSQATVLTLAQVAAATDYAARDLATCEGRIVQRLGQIAAEAERLRASLSVDRALVETATLWDHLRAIEGDLGALDKLTEGHRRLDRLRDLIQRGGPPPGPTIAEG